MSGKLFSLGQFIFFERVLLAHVHDANIALLFIAQAFFDWQEICSVPIVAG